MDSPSQRLFEDDVQSVPFRSGVFKGLWGMDDLEYLPVQRSCPVRTFWLSAVPHPNSPSRFYIQLDLTGYRSAAPTGTFWDPATKAILEFSKRPKGRPDSRVARVFRTDWNAGTAFYHPYDRVVATGHPDWLTQDPHRVWNSNLTIVDYLTEFHSLLNNGDYIGV
jgi:hypothetical protein